MIFGANERALHNKNFAQWSLSVDSCISLSSSEISSEDTTLSAKVSSCSSWSKSESSLRVSAPRSLEASSLRGASSVVCRVPARLSYAWLGPFQPGTPHLRRGLWPGLASECLSLGSGTGGPSMRWGRACALRSLSRGSGSSFSANLS